ncbi:recombinase family protein [Filobacillus milosensis]|uniref:Recombinase family protein n=1 Tax=Filobacillus milosensis TaxID=94137 RepID=A0A4Y8IJ13_9BACI|nr:recombinase family protein [Filobacillus milosensis]TFB13587.1 recombinase family protein [Filobacillus milosensis]
MPKERVEKNHQDNTIQNMMSLQEKFKEIINDVVGPIQDESFLPPLKTVSLEKDIKPAIGYIRYSDKKQDDNNSVEMQKRQIENKASLEGYHIILWSMDKAVSATHKDAINRPWMKVLFNCASIEQFIGAIFFCEESRVSRRVNDFVRDVHDPLKEEKPTLKFFSTTEPDEWDPTKPHIQAKLLIYRNESEYKKDRTVRYQNNCLYPSDNQKPKRPGSALPYGYTKDNNGEIIIDNTDNKADIVYLINYLSSVGYSNKFIATLLNDCEIPSPKGKSWVASMIDKIIQNLFYQGYLTWNVRESRTNSARKKLDQIDIFKSSHEPIIPPHLAEAVKQMKSFKNQFGRNMDTPFTLKDLLECKNCHVPLTSKNFTSGKSNNQKYVYRCTSCKNFVEVEKVHDIVFKKVFDHLSKNSVGMKKEALTMLKRWNKSVTQKQSDVLKTIQHVKEQERFVVNRNTPEEIEFANSIASTLDKLTKKVEELAEIIKKIEQLLDPTKLEILFTSFFKNDKSNPLSKLELRSLFLFLIEKIDLNLATNNVSINYRITPFVDIEKWISQATADLAM